jgi:hypothetical protein
MTDRQVSVQVSTATEKLQPSAPNLSTSMYDSSGQPEQHEDGPYSESAAKVIEDLRNTLERTQIENRQLRKLAEHDKDVVSPRLAKKIPDSLIAPKPFMGNVENQDPNDWLHTFELYSAFKGLDDEETCQLFVMLLQGTAADWLASIEKSFPKPPTFEQLKKAFTDNYFEPKELRWRQASDLWHESQHKNERVHEYVTRMRKLARQLDFPSEIIHMAIVQGFRAPIRAQVIQKGLTTLDETIRCAQLAESAEPLKDDTMSAALLELMKASLESSQKQATELHNLSGKVATMTSNVAQQAPRRDDDAHRNQIQQQTSRGPRFVKRTPQNIQRYNFPQPAANANTSEPQSFREPTDHPVCTNCLLDHPTGQQDCRARGQVCFNCQRPDHFSPACRSAKRSDI